MKRYLIEVPDEFSDRVEEVIDTEVVTSYREFTEMKSKKADEESITPTPLAAPEPAEEPLKEDQILSECAELSRRLALLSKKKRIEQRK